MQFMESSDLSPIITTPSRPGILLFLPLYRDVTRIFAILLIIVGVHMLFTAR